MDSRPLYLAFIVYELKIEKLYLHLEQLSNRSIATPAIW